MQPGLSDRYRDSITSSDSFYSNPYRQDLDYARGNQLRANLFKNKDTLENSQSQLEERLFDQFRENKFRLPLGKFAFIGQIGKYAFFAILLPPYIICWGIPKWIFQKTGPFVGSGFQSVGWLLEKISGSTNEFYQRLSEKIKLLIARKNTLKTNKESRTQAIQTLLKQNFAYARKAHQLLQQQLGVYLRQSLEPFKRVGQFLKHIGNGALIFKNLMKENLQNQLEKQKWQILKVAEKLKEKLIRNYKKLEEPFKKYYEQIASVANFAILVLYKPILITWNFSLQFYSSLSFAWPKNSGNAFKKMVDLFSKSANNVKNQFSKNLNRLAKTGAFIAKGMIKIADTLIKPLANFKNHALTLKAKAVETIRNFTAHSTSFLKKSFNPVRRFILRKLREREGGFKKTKQFFKNTKEKLFKKKNEISTWLLYKIKTFPGLVFDFIKLALLKTRIFMQYLWAWTRILARYGWQVLNEL